MRGLEDVRFFFSTLDIFLVTCAIVLLLLLLLRKYYFDSRIFVSPRRDIYIDPKRRLSVFEHRTGIEYFLFLIIFE